MPWASKLLLPALSLAVFWIWETWRPFMGQPRGRLRHASRNLALALLNAAVIALGFGVVVALVLGAAAEQRVGLLRLLEAPPWLSAAVALLLLDAAMYVWHRANHTVAFFWRFHRVHHSDPHMDVTTATRFHLGEHAGALLVRLALIPLVGLELSHLLLYDLILVVMTQFHHADISLGRFDRLLRFVIVTPDMHKVHHSDLQPETDSNYSVVLSLWDRLGRTHVVRSDTSSVCFGLSGYEPERWQTLAGMLKTPFLASSGAAGAAESPREPSSEA
jgi:sterol desaturase/sphingolipid hydroxylase (fatty acid hydroxylase superfamily)